MKKQPSLLPIRRQQREGWVEGYMRRYNFLSIALSCFDFLKPFNGLYIKKKKQIKSIRMERRQRKWKQMKLIIIQMHTLNILNGKQKEKHLF